MLEEIYNRAKNAQQPLSVHFELTRKCNLKCRHCYISPGGESGMSGEHVKGVLDKLAGEGTLFITFTGGEPLMRDDFFDIAEYARRLNYSVRVFTNGTLVDRAAADRMSELNFYEVGISLYGVRAETHENITGAPGSFAKTMNALRMLTERGVRVALKSVIMKPNFDEYGDLIEFARALGARYVFDPTVFPRDDGGKEPLALRLDDEQLEAVFSDPRFYPRNTGRPAGERDCRGPVCDLNFVSLGVSPEGDVFPCLQLRQPAGNILEMKMSDLKTSFNTNIKHNTTNLSNICYNCKLQSNCTRCPGLALLEDGDVLGKSSWACRMALIRERMRAG
jgi:AdoMet-dependent heme synthase